MYARTLRRSHASVPTLTDPLEMYRSLVLQGKVRQDLEQMRALVGLQKLHRKLFNYIPPVTLFTLIDSMQRLDKAREFPFKRSVYSELGTGLLPEEEEERNLILSYTPREKQTALVKVMKEYEDLEKLATPQGFLLTGKPGTGKTMLMNLFFQTMPTPHKVRFHYHHFLLYLYAQIHKELQSHSQLTEEMRQERKAIALSRGWQTIFGGGRSPNDFDLNNRDFVLAQIAKNLIEKHGWLLAFDEVQMVDIAGAGLISRVMSWYWRLGGVVIGTSNRVPQDLYNKGVQRSTINPFLLALGARSPAVEVYSDLDYRREKSHARIETGAGVEDPKGELWKPWAANDEYKVWFSAGEESQFKTAVGVLVGDSQGHSAVLDVYKRKVTIPWQANGVARFTFHELCEKALGPADYMSIASHFHTLILTDVPVLKLNAKNEARRLITLLDALYESKTNILVQAAAKIDDLFFPDAITTPVEPEEEPEEPQFDAPVHVLPPVPSDAQAYDESAMFNAFIQKKQEEKAQKQHKPQEFSQKTSGRDEYEEMLEQEMAANLSRELESPYRPNVSSYDGQSIEDRSYSASQKEKEFVFAEVQPTNDTETTTSTTLPNFKNLAIFTGEEERFAFQRAVSRVYEMCSTDYTCFTPWEPLHEDHRIWETAVPGSRVHVADTDPVIEANRIADEDNHKPRIKGDHVWGVRNDWGERAGPWGKGTDVYKKTDDE